jgi:hypothetical protein
VNTGDKTECERLAVVVHNERVKLLANAFDRTSTACIAVGVIGQSIAGGFHNITWIGVLGMGSWLFCALVLHLAARHTLGRMRL